MRHRPSLLRLFSWLLLPLLLTSFASRADATLSPEAVLKGSTQALFDNVKAQRALIDTQPAVMFDVVEQSLIPHVDIERMSRLVLGKHWRTANDAQRTRFVAEFQILLVRFYTAAILDKPEKIDEVLAIPVDQLVIFQPATLDNKGRIASVRAEVHLPSGQVIPATFRLFRSSDTDAWKLIDLTVEGISLVTNYRGTFNSEINSAGIDGMLDRLSERNLELKNKFDQTESPSLASETPTAQPTR